MNKIKKFLAVLVIKYSLILKKYDGKEVNIKRIVAGISNETVKKAIADNIY